MECIIETVSWMNTYRKQVEDEHRLDELRMEDSMEQINSIETKVNMVGANIG